MCSRYYSHYLIDKPLIIILFPWVVGVGGDEDESVDIDRNISGLILGKYERNINIWRLGQR